MATSIMPNLLYQTELTETKVENPLSADEISQIEQIRNEYEQQLKASKKKLVKVQEIFNQNLTIDTNETEIRLTFPPVAKAMEDIVVQQIMMMQKVNTIISAHMIANSSRPTTLSHVEPEKIHELNLNKKQ